MDLLNKIIIKAAGIPQKPLSSVTFWLVVVLILYLSAQITWKLIPVSNEPQTWRPMPVSSHARTNVNIVKLQQLALFGKVDANSTPKVETVVEMITDAPKTSLSIQLTGVVASTIQQKGLAVIASTGSQNTYGLGDKIKGTSASLKEVYADRIIITNSGRYETLMLDGLKYETNGQANKQLQRQQSVRKIDQRKNKQVAQEIELSREELLADPSKITDFISISPVKSNGELSGYRLNPGKDRALFKLAGFKGNDLAKSMNGYDLTSMSQSMEVMALLPELTEISLMVEREGQLIEIMFSLPE
ncbi:MAG: type II secretion system protein GspC [Shewanella sp.]